MKHRLHPGDHMPEFSYDTPYEPQNSFYNLLAADERPLFMVFLRNFGHPFTRHYIVRYAQSIRELYSARLVCVVQTRPETISPHLPKGTMPYPVICDAEGALYDYFEIPRLRGRMRTLSWEGLRILKAAEKQGYHESKETAQQMPLTLLVSPGGEVLLAHYGRSVTDQPEDCAAMETVCQEMCLAARQAQKKGRRKGEEPLPEELFEQEEPKRRPPAPALQEEEAGLPLGQLPLPPKAQTPLAPPAKPAVPIPLTDRSRRPAPENPAAPAAKPAGGVPVPLAGKEKEPAAPAAKPAAMPPAGGRAAARAGYAASAALAGDAAAPQTPPAPAGPDSLPDIPPEKPVPAPAVPPKPDIPPAAKPITSPSGSAAEDLALQKFRSAAAALFSDEF